MISQWWSLVPPTVFAVGGVLRDRMPKKEYIGLFVLSNSGIAWLAYGVARNEVTVWVVGALIASAYYIKLQNLVKAGSAGTLDEEDNTSSREF